MRKLPSLQSLRAFEAAARLQSFLLASEELHLTPSAISHQVRGLEAYLGQSLFTRSNRRVELTDSGARLLGTLSTVFDMVEEACLDLSAECCRRVAFRSLHTQLRIEVARPSACRLYA